MTGWRQAAELTVTVGAAQAVAVRALGVAVGVVTLADGVARRRLAEEVAAVALVAHAGAVAAILVVVVAAREQQRTREQE